MSAGISVLGAGAFGTALAAVAASEGNAVTLVGRNAGRMQEIEENRVSETALPGVTLPESLRVTADPAALSDADIVLLVVPAQSLRDALQAYGSAIAGGRPDWWSAPRASSRQAGSFWPMSSRRCCPVTRPPYCRVRVLPPILRAACRPP